MQKQLILKNISRKLTGKEFPSDKDFEKLIEKFSKSISINMNNVENIANPSSAPIQIIDLFCGCGGTSSGFLLLNKIFPIFKIVSAWDIDPAACSTYSQLGFNPICNDIEKILKNKSIINKIKSKINDSSPSILIGCPPCQGFSAHTKVNWNAKEDKRNGLVEEFSKIATKLEPDYIFMENVPELLSAKYGNHFTFFKKKLESKGYSVKSSVVNMAHFGLPQARKRAIVLASKESITLPKPILNEKNFVTVRHAISHLPKIKSGVKNPNDPLHVTAGHRKSTLEVIRSVPKNGGSRKPGIGPKCLDKVNGFSDVYGRMKWDAPSITITAYARNPASGRFTHPEQNRGLSIREASILQGFPISFSFDGSFDKKFSLIGNAVPPLFASTIAVHIISDMLKNIRIEGHLQVQTRRKKLSKSLN